MLSSIIFVVCLAVCATQAAFVPRDRVTALPRARPLFVLKEPSPKQQEQLDKYGPTPETTMEMFFDQLVMETMSGEDEKDHSPVLKKIFNGPGGEEWKKLVTGLREARIKKEAAAAAKENPQLHP